MGLLLAQPDGREPIDDTRPTTREDGEPTAGDRRVTSDGSLTPGNAAVSETLVSAELPSPITGTAKQNAVFSRPFMLSGPKASIGGYTEINLNYSRTDGVNEGPAFELRRFDLFVYSPINRFVRVVADVEFEHGQEIHLENATVDVEVAPELLIRGGIILTPLGAFNQAHDGPLWDFVERPLVSTTLIPATFSEVGAGAHGTILIGPLDLDYQAYLTQGLADGVLDNALGRTSIPAGRSPGLFAEDNNNSPALSGRAAVRYRRVAEVGGSAYYGAFNTYVIDGLHVDRRRDLSIFAVDYRLSLPLLELRGEAAQAHIDVPASLRSIFGNRQRGVYVEAVVPTIRFAALGYDATQIDLGARFDYVDYNVGSLPTTGTSAGDDVTRATATVAWRWSASTVLRLNYGYTWTRDLVNSAIARTGALQLGFATYF